MNSENQIFKRDKIELIKFDRNHCKGLLTKNKIKTAKKYLKYFFFPFQNKIFFFNGYEFILYNREEALKLIPDDFKISIMIPNEQTKKFDKEEISLKSYLKSTEFMDIEYKPTIDFSNEELVTSKKVKLRQFTFDEYFLNMAKPYNYDILIGKPIERTSEIQKSIEIINEHIKIVLCSGNEETFSYVLNFIACSFFGRKLRKALILQSRERTGKGIIINNVLKEILGDRMFKTNSVESIMKYTKSFEGCCLLNFDELPYCENYKGLQDNLKGLITEPTFNCRDMYSSGYEQKNTFNILITTNNDSVTLTQNNNSRYVCLDINEEKIGDTEYFKKLNKAIKTNGVLETFYNDMNERFKTLENWNEDNMPFTETRKMKIIEALPRLYKYIKEHYISYNRDINVRTNEFLEEYKLITKDSTSPQKLGRLLKDIGITPKKNSNNNGYNYIKSSKDLLEIFKSKNWIDDIVDVINDIDDKNKEDSDDLDHGVDYEDEKTSAQKDLEKALLKIKELEEIIENSKKETNKIIKSTKIIKEIKQDDEELEKEFEKIIETTNQNKEADKIDDDEIEKLIEEITKPPKFCDDEIEKDLETIETIANLKNKNKKTEKPKKPRDIKIVKEHLINSIDDLSSELFNIFKI